MIASPDPIPGNPLENIKGAINPVKIAEQAIPGVSAEKAAGKFNKGDHLYVQRVGYTHHCIYIGGGDVVLDTIDSISDKMEDTFEKVEDFLNIFGI